MSNQSTDSKNVTWRRGFHRVFVLLWMIWALFVLVGLPILEVKRAGESAATMYKWSHEYPIQDEKERAERDRLDNERWAHASLAYIYKNEVFPNIHWFLLFIALPPIILYGLIRGVISVGKWIYSGFRAA